MKSQQPVEISQHQKLKSRQSSENHQLQMQESYSWS